MPRLSVERLDGKGEFALAEAGVQLFPDAAVVLGAVV